MEENKLPSQIKYLLNSICPINQSIGVNIAFQNGHTHEDIAYYVLNYGNSYTKSVSKVARNYIAISWKKSFLGKTIAIRAKIQTEEPLQSEFYIRMDRWHRGCIYRQYKDRVPDYPKKTKFILLHSLVELIKSEMFIIQS